MSRHKGSGDDSGGGNGDPSIAIDDANNVYVTGTTSSTNFPTMNPLQPNYGGGSYDVFVSKLSAAGNTLLYSTYLGGSSSDGSGGIAVDSAGNAYITGDTYSSNFPVFNPLQPSNGGGGNNDAFVTALNSTGSAYIYSTYLGGSFSDSASGIAVDALGNAYVTGSTGSSDFPAANAVQPTYGGSGDAFVSKLNQTGLVLVYSTFWEGAVRILARTSLLMSTAMPT